MSKLDKKVAHKANIPLSSHDLSHTFDYTSAVGMILPVTTDILNPGEKISVNVDLSNTRTMPLSSAAFCDIDLHVDYFFVPMTLLYSPFESMIYQINDNYSSVFSNPLTVGLPLVNMTNVRNAVEGNHSVWPAGMYQGFYECYGKSYFRLMDMLGMNPLFGTMHDYVVNQINPVDGAYVPNVFPWQILAYNACYQYYFRNDDFEKFNQNTFNFDQFSSSSTPVTTYSLDNFLIKYRQNYGDYFNSIKNSPIVTATNLSGQPDALPLAKSWLTRDITSVAGRTTLNALSNGWRGVDGSVIPSQKPNSILSGNVNTQFGFAGGVFGPDSYNSSNVNPNGTDINTANIRAMFANEKLWSITGATRKTYDAQTLAHFGFSVPHDVKHQISHFGHDVNTIHIGEVISTAGTSTQPLGTIAGKGYAENRRGKMHTFTAPCHGCLMVVTSAMIKPNYVAGYNKINAIAGWQDFYQPEFDHLGMQPIFGYEVTLDSGDAGTLYGWQYRYEQFKRKYNHASRAFADGYFSTWSNVQRPYKDVKSAAVNVPTDLYSFLASPKSLDNIMITTFDTSWDDNFYNDPCQIYECDPFVHHAIINYKKLSTMSTYSMPRLDA